MCSGDDVVLLRADGHADRRGDRFDPLRLLGVVAQLFLKLEMGQLLDPIGQRLAAIGLVEKLRVGEARVGDEGVAVRGVAVRIRLVVQHGQE